jgi:hypothetical protein
MVPFAITKRDCMIAIFAVTVLWTFTTNEKKETWLHMKELHAESMQAIKGVETKLVARIEQSDKLVNDRFMGFHGHLNSLKRIWE